MVKNQSIVDLWVKSGEILEDQDKNKVIENIEYYNLLMARIEQLCISSHDDVMYKVIPEYIQNGWIQAD